MATSQRRRRRSAEQWRGLIEQQTASGQTQEAFCIAHDLGFSTFKRWKGRFESEAQPPVSTHASASSDALFTPLSTPTDAGDSPGWTVELDLGGGLCLRLCREAP